MVCSFLESTSLPSHLDANKGKLAEFVWKRMKGISQLIPFLFMHVNLKLVAQTIRDIKSGSIKEVLLKLLESL